MLAYLYPPRTILVEGHLVSARFMSLNISALPAAEPPAKYLPGELVIALVTGLDIQWSPLSDHSSHGI